MITRAFIAIAFVFGLAACEGGSSQAAAKQSGCTGSEEGCLPDVKYVDTTGKAYTFQQLQGKVVLVNFWATWCPPCIEEMPAMERLWRKHKDAGFVLVAVSVDTDPQKVTPFVNEHKLTFPVAFDTKMATADRYGVRALPSSFIVGRDGTLAALALGPRHWDDKASHRLIEAMAR
jgi:peroxiredoxin